MVNDLGPKIPVYYLFIKVKISANDLTVHGYANIISVVAVEHFVFAR